MRNIVTYHLYRIFSENITNYELYLISSRDIIYVELCVGAVGSGKGKGKNGKVKGAGSLHNGGAPVHGSGLGGAAETVIPRTLITDYPACADGGRLPVAGCRSTFVIGARLPVDFTRFSVVLPSLVAVN